MATAAYRGEIFHLRGDPAAGAEAIGHHADGLIVVEDGEIAACGDFVAESQRLPDDTAITHYESEMIVPGFVDAHIHFPQVDIIGAYGARLMDWLERYTFPSEMAFADAAHAAEVAEIFLDELLRNGTTSALVFATVHKTSVDALFTAAAARNMRLVAGKVLMDRNAPAALLQSPEQGDRESRELIRAWHGKGRLGYAVTPRFAPTSTAEQLALAGQLMREHDGLLMQTHLSENPDEIRTVAELFPEAHDYLDVYDRAGLVTDRSVFAHGIHLSDREFGRLGEAGAAIAFCPTSNLFLGSGLFKLAKSEASGITVGLGTDVGAGTSFSAFQTMNEAYKVGQLAGAGPDAFKLFYLATLAGAKALKAEDRIGNLAPGKEADFLILDPTATPLLKRRMAACTSLGERLFVLATLGDDRAVKHTYVAGKLAHSRET